MTTEQTLRAALEEIIDVCKGELTSLDTWILCHDIARAALAATAIPAAPEQADANDICQVPPTGWYCTRKAGHEGPCAAHPHEPDRELDADDHASIARGMDRIKAASQQAAPEQETTGWKLVPVEPTAHMISRGLEKYLLVMKVGMPEYEPLDAVEMGWAAMLAAAPSPQQRDESKDAERYRWLQDWYLHEGQRSEIDPLGHIRQTTPEIMNAAIDAAIEQERTS